MDGNAIEEEASVQQPTQISPQPNPLNQENAAGIATQSTPETAIPQGLPVAGPVIASGEENITDEREQSEEGENKKSQVELEDEATMQLGDHYEIQMATGKKISGIIYFVDSEKLIRILPDGVNHKLEDIPLVEITDPDTGESYTDIDPELQVTEIVLTQKGSISSFVDLIGLRIGQRLTTFKSDQSLGPILEVTAVNSEKDSIRVVQSDDTFEREIDFNHKGIPLDEEFVIMQIKQDELPQEDQVEVESAPIGILPEGVELEIEEIGEIVLPSRMQVQEILATERIYDERQQKNSFIEDLRTMLEVTAQNNPTVLKNIRVMTEVFSDLKNSILKRDDAGYPIGEKQSTIETINDLITLTKIPIARPILDTKRIIVSEEQSDLVNPQLDTYTLKGIIEPSVTYLETMGGIEADIDSVGMPRWYLVWSSYFKRFPMGDAYQNVGYSMQQDMEYFRHEAPVPVKESSTDGLKKIGGSMHFGRITGKKNPSVVYSKGNIDLFLKKLSFSYRRGHGPVLRGLPRGGTEVVAQGDRATRSGTVLFPFEAALDGAVGATRTGNLWELLQRSFASKTWMHRILKTYNMPTSELNTRKVVHITNTNVDVIKTQFIEYLRDVLDHISLKGRGDLYKINADLGIQDIELTTAQVGVVDEKVKTMIAGLRQYITDLRNELAKPAEKPKVAPFLNVEILEALSKVLQKEPLLEELIQEMNAKLPNYKDIDIAIFSYLLVYAQDYILAALSGNENYASRERARFERNRLIETLIANRKLRELEESKGHTPEVNPCRHVKDLHKIRKIKNESERLAILTQFLVQYDGGVDGNWIKCHRCKKHLICRHEVLQIQQFLHPNEQQIIQKQLVLGFAGGRQGDKYICRNCGQPMAEIEFDTSLEYNDEGVPMMGRKVIVDKDALEKERIQGLLGIRLDTDEKMKFKNDTQRGLYTILRLVQTKFGVEIDKRGISRILDMGEREVLSLMSEKEYVSSKRKIKYIDYKTRRTIAIISALVLIEIQTHVPNYQVRFAVEGCKPGFGGFPLVETANPENEDESIGIQYITCILNQIHEKGAPWTNGFQTISRDEERRATIKSQIVYYCTELAKDNTIQTMIREKQEFERNVYGVAAAKGRPSEYIPSGFLPRQETFQEATDNAAQAPTVPEGAPRTNLGRLVLADTWIRAANRAIREKGEPNIIKYSPFIETSCCLNPIKEPQRFWSTVSLPPAPPLTTLGNPFLHKSIAYTSFIPRPLQVLQESAPDASTYYKVVLKLCYKGTHLGQPHEFGADNKCDWCDLEIPVDLQNPDVDKNGIPEINWERVKSELDRQGVQVSEQIFQQILDKSHQLNTFAPYIQSKSLTPLQLYTFVKTIVPEPVPNFAASIETAKTALSKLSVTASKEEILQTILPLTRGPIREGDDRGEYQLQEDNLKQLLGDDFRYLQALLNESPESIFNILLSYFVVPAERLVKGRTEIDSYLEGTKQLKLGDAHETEIKSMLTKHLETLLNLERDAYGVRKLQNYVTTMSKFLSMSHDLRASRLRSKFITMSLEGSVLFFNRIVRIFVISTLANLIDPDIRAIDEAGNKIGGDIGNSQSFLENFVKITLKQYMSEHLVYNPTIVKKKIEEANEMEHQRFIDYLDKLTDAEKRLEMTKKNLGIGMWAIGGTKATYQYDADYWEQNREAVASSYEKAAAFDPNMQLPAAMQLMNTTGYAEEGMGEAQNEGYEYSFVADDD